MPRKPGERIESPATLGRKCWAFAYLAQQWGSSLGYALQRIAASGGLHLSNFLDAFEHALNKTLPLCNQVLANCFVNSTYDPLARNGTCPNLAAQFYVGYSWENGLRGDSVAFPFNSYNQTKEFHDDAKFAVNTVLNFIV